MVQAGRQITIQEANSIHARVIKAVFPELPESFYLAYSSYLRFEHDRSGTTGLQIPSPAGAVFWYVAQRDSKVLFKFWVSIETTTQTVCKVRGEGRDLFLNVSFVDQNRGADAKLPELGGKSVRELMQLAAVAPAEAQPARGAAVIPAKESGSESEPRGADEAIAKQMAEEARRITLHEANVVHWRFVEAAMRELPDNVVLAYAGNLRYDDGRRKHPAEGPPNPAEAVRWQVRTAARALFTFWVSVERNKQSVGEMDIEHCTLFLNVSQIDGGRGLDEKHPQLGYRTVRSIIELAEREPVIKDGEVTFPE